MYEHHKYKNKNYKTIRRKHMGGFSCPQIGQWILRSDTKNTSSKRKINWNLCKKKKKKTFVYERTLSREFKENLQNGKRF